jgi:hypothetical protein
MKNVIISVVSIILLQSISLHSFAQNWGKLGQSHGEKLGRAITDIWDDGINNPVSIGDEYNYWAIGLGNGASYGGRGIKILKRLGEEFVVPGISAGIGYNPDGRNKLENVSGSIFWTIGLQMYIENFYFDMQFGQMERVKYKEKEKNQFGMALMLGYNWFFYDKWGINAALGLAGPMAMTENDKRYINSAIFKEENMYFVWEVGLLYKF